MILFDTKKRHQKVVNDVIWFFLYTIVTYEHILHKKLDLNTYLSAWNKSVGKILFNKNWQKTTVPFLYTYAPKHFDKSKKAYKEVPLGLQPFTIYFEDKGKEACRKVPLGSTILYRVFWEGLRNRPGLD